LIALRCKHVCVGCAPFPRPVTATFPARYRLPWVQVGGFARLHLYGLRLFWLDVCLWLFGYFTVVTFGLFVGSSFVVWLVGLRFTLLVDCWLVLLLLVTVWLAGWFTLLAVAPLLRLFMVVNWLVYPVGWLFGWFVLWLVTTVVGCWFFNRHYVYG